MAFGVCLLFTVTKLVKYFDSAYMGQKFFYFLKIFFRLIRRYHLTLRPEPFQEGRIQTKTKTYTYMKKIFTTLAAVAMVAMSANAAVTVTYEGKALENGAVLDFGNDAFKYEYMSGDGY